MKGTPNRTTSEFRTLLQSVIENQFSTIELDLQTLKPYQRLDILCRLLSYCVPKPTEQTFHTPEKIEFIITNGKTIL
jgi:hypothetical protein